MKEEHKITKQLILEGKTIESILRRAVHHALLEHRRAGNPIASSKDGRVILIPAEEIQLEDEADTKYFVN